MTSYLQEIYIGKTSQLLEIEKLIGQARNKFGDESQYFKGVKINSSKEFYDINRAFENMFGFKIFSLNIIPSTQLNAYTMPISYALDIAPQFRIKKNLIADSSGFKFKKEAGYVCVVCMYSGLFFNRAYTDGEILAVILHEIGHNFQSVLNKKIFYLQDITFLSSYIVTFALTIIQGNFDQAIDSAISIITATNTVKLMKVKFNENVAKIPGLNVILGTMSAVSGVITDLKYNILYILNQVYKYGSLPITVMGKILSKILSPLGKEKERVADSFAQVYGYGPELSSCVTKFEYKDSGLLVKDVLYSVPIYGKFMELYDLPYTMILSAFSDHPTGMQRAMMIRKSIELELDKNDVDTVLRSKLKQDLKDLDEVLNKYNDIVSKQEEPGAIKMAWFRFVYEFQDNENTKATNRVSRDIEDTFSSTILK